MPDDRPDTTDRTLMSVPLHMAEAVSAVLRGAAVVVPMTATMDQRTAAFDRDMGPDDDLYLSIYRAMVAASPYAQETNDDR